MTYTLSRDAQIAKEIYDPTPIPGLTTFILEHILLSTAQAVGYTQAKMVYYDHQTIPTGASAVLRHTNDMPGHGGSDFRYPSRDYDLLLLFPKNPRAPKDEWQYHKASVGLNHSFGISSGRYFKPGYVAAVREALEPLGLDLNAPIYQWELRIFEPASLARMNR